MIKTPSEYVKLAIRTESTKDDQWVERLYHSSIGCVTEAGEFMDIIKRHGFYNQSIDKKHAAKELGDILWYVAIGCDALGLSMEHVMEANIEKLRARYPEKFTERHAAVRDLEKEDAAADKKLNHCPYPDVHELACDCEGAGGPR